MSLEQALTALVVKVTGKQPTDTSLEGLIAFLAENWPAAAAASNKAD